MNIYEKLLNVKSSWIKLQRDVSAYNYKYADLNQIQEKLWDVLQEQKLLVLHRVQDNQVMTKIINTENTEEFVESTIPMAEWTKAQDKGSEITYYRRYNLLSLLDLEVEDDDGKKAQDSKPIKKEVDLPWIAQENIDKITDLIAEWQHFTMKQVREKYKVSRANAEILKWLWIE